MVAHVTLRHELSRRGRGNTTLALPKNSLEGDTRRTTVDEETSQPLDVICGAPQGVLVYFIMPCDSKVLMYVHDII